MGGLVKEIGFNYYSAVFTNDHFNRGISTDRFIVEWMIGSERVRERMEEGRIPTADAAAITIENTINEIQIGADGLESHGERWLFQSIQSPLFIEIPYNQDRLLKTDRDRAQALRDKCRALFMHYLARGYVVNDLIVKQSPDGRRHAYYRLDQDIQWQRLRL